MAGIIYFYSSGFTGAIFFKTQHISKLFTLGSRERLKSRKLIEQLFKTGKSFSVFPFRVYYIYGEKVFSGTEPRFPVQFGVGVGTRNFKKAVDRNRIKRLTREAYRLQKLPLCTLVKEQNRQLAVFFIYTGKELPGYNTLSEKLALTLERLMKAAS